MQKPINYAVSFVQLYQVKPVHLVHIWLLSLKRYLLQNSTKPKLNMHKESDRGTHTDVSN